MFLGYQNVTFCGLVDPTFSSNEEGVLLDVPLCSKYTNNRSTPCNIQSFENHLLFTYNDRDLHIEHHLEAYSIFTNAI